jgi:pseudouridine-5'-phosphate glycosidase
MNSEEIAMVIRMAFMLIMLDTNNTLRSRSGILIAVPPPATPPLITKEDLETKIQEGLQKADTLSIRGKAVTPFLLDYLKKSTEGITLAKSMSFTPNYGIRY